MEDNRILEFVSNILENMPSAWLRLTTHRLDIYNEKLAKVEFTEQLEDLYLDNNFDKKALEELPTAYDYIRLGHPLSCLLEWGIAKLNNVDSNQVISFSSKSMPILAILRKNSLNDKKTQILYSDKAPSFLDADLLKNVYGYDYEIMHVDQAKANRTFEGSNVFVSENDDLFRSDASTIDQRIDFYVNVHSKLGSVLIVRGKQNESYISSIQHVRRRETIAMTPANCLLALKMLTKKASDKESFDSNAIVTNRQQVINSIKEITGAYTKALVGSSGLSIQYAIMMGLIHDAQLNHPGKAIKFIVPPNCYGGTNDQARRVAASIDNVEVVDLPVDGEHDMVESVDSVLEKIAKDDAVPYIIAEIPTNPRVEVPDLVDLKNALSKERRTENGDIAIDPVFILDQTFCPNVLFLGEGKILSSVRTISYASGSKFPSGGLCTAGYCVGNKQTERLMEKIEQHLILCDNEATAHQMEILAKQLPSMNQRIADAYMNTREFVTYIREILPEAKINFVSEELAAQGFTPSVFSLDLPTKGRNDKERESYKRALNHKLINLMITEIPNESKYCVSYGQLKGCYWTIPATSTQGTTKEGDKDYIARVSLSPNTDLDRHKEVFAEFVAGI